ncbi:hypothetical protein [Curvivirga sp.]|uniref:hypothetical protein n=1 Tax=Curvivirga sp. TaxID=2856848 RepID=UPI003B5AFF8F
MSKQKKQRLKNSSSAKRNREMIRLGNIKFWHLAVVLALAILATTPKYKDIGCLEKITLANYVNFSFNCDSPELTNRQLAPHKFFTEYHNWKGRPVYFTYGLVVGYALSGPTAFIKPLISIEDSLGIGRAAHISKVLNFYLAYFILNISIVFMCCWCAIRISGLQTTSYTAAALTLVIASLDVVEAGTFLLHTVIMNLPVAIGACFYCILGAQFKLLSRFSYISLGLFIGLSILVYPAFAILVPAFFCGLAYGIFVLKSQRNISIKLLLWNIVLFIGLSLIPVLFWTNLNQYIFETSTYLTLDKGQFKWLPEALKQDNWLELIFTRAEKFLFRVYLTTKIEVISALFAFLGILVWAIYKNRTLRSPFSDLPLFALLISILGVLSFNFLQGYYAPRMHYCIAALLYIAVMRFAVLQKSDKAVVPLFLGISVVHFYDAIFYFTITGD